MDSQIIALILATLLLAGCIYLIWRLNAPRQDGQQRLAKAKNTDNLDTLTSWNPEPSRVLTAQERIAFNTLKEAVPECILLAQVPLARFLRVPTRNSYHEWLRRVGQLCADIAVCDSNSLVIAVVEVRALDGKESERGLRRHERMDKVLSAAGIPVIVWREGAIPRAVAARAALLSAQVALPQVVVSKPIANPDLAAPAAAPAPTSAFPLPPSRPTIDDDIEVRLPDSAEFSEQREPPPSTWFDDLDSAPLPLDQKAH